MFSCRFYLFCLVAILCISLCDGNSSVKKCAEGDRQALLKFKAGLIDEGNTLSSWNGEDCCKWEGITCDNSTGHVTRLYLEDGLAGKIDSSLCELQHLTSLDLSFNNLEGKIPKCIGSLGQLIELKLASNRLVSAIPHSLGNLSNLQTLDLRGNHLFVANDLEWVSHISYLRYLDLSRNNLSQAVGWLSSISKLPSLQELYLDNCVLPQFNMKSIPQMNSSTSLEILSLSGNSLTTSTLSWVLNVSKVLKYLDLSHNEIEDIPKSFQSFCQLESLKLSFNKLFGQLSDQIRNLCSGENGIMDLDLSHNQLTGTLPYTTGQFSNLRTLSVISNKLNGVINEAHLSNLSNLQFLYMDQNSLSFKLSSNWVPPFQVAALSASSCILGPNFPSWLKHQRRLEVLQISNSGILGSFPKWFWDLSPGLIYLNVSHNKLSGALPKSIPSMTDESQRIWDLSFNNFSGPLPHFPPSLSF